VLWCFQLYKDFPPLVRKWHKVQGDIFSQKPKIINAMIQKGKKRNLYIWQMKEKFHLLLKLLCFMSISRSTNSAHWSLGDAAKPHLPVLESLTQAVLLYALIWQNWWQDEGAERGGGAVEVVADRPGVAMFETDLLLRWLSCHFISSLCAWRFPGAATTRGPGARAGGQCAFLRSLPNLPAYHHGTEFPRWQRGDFFNTLVGSATVTPSVISISLSLPSLRGPSHLSISKKINKK